MITGIYKQDNIFTTECVTNLDQQREMIKYIQILETHCMKSYKPAFANSQQNHYLEQKWPQINTFEKWLLPSVFLSSIYVVYLTTEKRKHLIAFCSCIQRLVYFAEKCGSQVNNKLSVNNLTMKMVSFFIFSTTNKILGG